MALSANNLMVQASLQVLCPTNSTTPNFMMNHLTKGAVVGVPNGTDTGILAAWLRYTGCQYTGHYILNSVLYDPSDGSSFRVPRALGVFIQLFDTGNYPQLEVPQG